MNAYSWYATLIKPWWSSPAWVFGPVWTLLYAIIAVTYGTVFYKVFTGALPWRVALPFALNLVFNFAFTWLQFPSTGSGQVAFQHNYIASVDVILVLLTLVWAIAAVWPHMRWVALANIPYLVWVSFATMLHLTITHLNK